MQEFFPVTGWIILAEALMGHGERAFGYFMENAPAAQNDKAEIRRLEPYCYGQFTEGKQVRILAVLMYTGLLELRLLLW